MLHFVEKETGKTISKRGYIFEYILAFTGWWFIFWVVVCGGRYILAGDGWWWIYFGWCLVVSDIFWLVVGGGGRWHSLV